MAAFSELLDETLPDLGHHFENVNLRPPDYAQQWFLSFFINHLPLQTVLIVWDGIVCDGPGVLLQTSLTLLRELQQILLAKEFEGIMDFFRVMGVCDEDSHGVTIGQLLMRRSRRIAVPQHML